jgi:sugar phosphate isomerase/epimerase
MKRRDFLAKSSLLTLAPFVSKFNDSNALAGVRVPGLQLFTLFGQIDKDAKGILKRVADLGVKEIESAFSFLPGFYGMSAQEFDGYLKSVGMTWTSHHVIGAPLKPRPGMDVSKFPKFLNLRDNAEEAIHSVAGTSVKYLVCANIPIESKKEVDEAVEILSKSAEIAKKAGLTFCFHNHDAEFKEVEGVRPFDVFAKEISADLLKFEIDLGWASKAGVNIPELFKQHPGRFPLCHLKDFTAEFKEMLPLGTGVLDYKPILAAANVGGLKHYFIEHDMPKDAFNSIEVGVKNFNRM